jgi:hypothetical protein
MRPAEQAELGGSFLHALASPALLRFIEIWDRKNTLRMGRKRLGDGIAIFLWKRAHPVLCGILPKQPNSQGAGKKSRLGFGSTLKTLVLKPDLWRNDLLASVSDGDRSSVHDFSQCIPLFKSQFFAQFQAPYFVVVKRNRKPSTAGMPAWLSSLSDDLLNPFLKLFRNAVR